MNSKTSGHLKKEINISNATKDRVEACKIYIESKKIDKIMIYRKICQIDLGRKR